MVKQDPIKRGKELVSLSRDHHDGLLLCWKINTGINNGVSTDRISAYILYFFDNNLNKHFEYEECFVFTLLPSEHPNRIEAELHHKLIREMIGNFKNNNQLFPLSMKYFAEILEMHIRYEERVLFNIIEKEANKQALQITEEKIGHTKCKVEWADQFWLKN